MPSKPDLPLTSHSQSHPMDEIECDIFELELKSVIAITDMYLGYFWYKLFLTPNTQSVWAALMEIFHLFDLPKRITSDNGPQFRLEFDALCKTLNIALCTTALYKPSSNGNAEAAVKPSKCLLQKASDQKY